MAIDYHSPEFMFGQILQRLSEGDKTIDNLTVEIKSMNIALNQFPCQLNQNRINALEAWRKTMNGFIIFKSEARIKFRHTLIVSLVTAVVTCSLTILATIIIS